MRAMFAYKLQETMEQHLLATLVGGDMFALVVLMDGNDERLQGLEQGGDDVDGCRLAVEVSPHQVYQRVDFRPLIGCRRDANYLVVLHRERIVAIGKYLYARVAAHFQQFDDTTGRQQQRVASMQRIFQQVRGGTYAALKHNYQSPLHQSVGLVQNQRPSLATRAVGYHAVLPGRKVMQLFGYDVVETNIFYVCHLKYAIVPQR